MRGKLRRFCRYAVFRRITPAGAGKTFPHLAVIMFFWDHPRRCGENHKLTVMCSDGKGSPPQVRGKRLCSLIFAATSRITPAGAGKTGQTDEKHLRVSDHPRRCGENIGDSLLRAVECGSPPQVRGKPFIVDGSTWKVRITPAGAGKTFRSCSRR